MDRLFRAGLITLLVVGSAQAVDNNARAIRSLGGSTQEWYAEPQDFDDADLTRDTLRHENGITDNYFHIPNTEGDDSLWVKFQPPRDFGRFGLWGFGIKLGQVPVRFGGPNGTPGMSVAVYESGEGLGGELGYPTQRISGYKTYNYEEIRFDTLANLPFTYYDLRDFGIGFNQSTPFHIVISVVIDSVGEKFGLLCDDAANPTDCSGFKRGDSDPPAWVKIVELFDGYNFAIRAVIADSILGVFELDPYTNEMFPISAELGFAFPNPFNSTSRIAFGVPIGTPYRVALFDPLGRQRAELAKGVGNGRGFLSLDAGNLSAGVYIVRLWTPYAIQSQRVMLVR